MQVVSELIRAESNGSLSFGDYTLAVKSKKENFEFNGDLYKVKTFNEITKLEKNDGFLYESVPGTAVFDLKLTKDNISFSVSSSSDAQITIGLDENTEYCINIAGEDAGCMKTGIGGKLNLSIELNSETPVNVTILRK